jgi:hypothetical protein
LWKVVFKIMVLAMARRIDAFPGDNGPRGNRKYPWHQWTDGSTWEILRGEDYDVATENMRVNLHMKADSLLRKARTRKFDDRRGEGLISQFLDSAEAQEVRQLAAQHGKEASALIDQLYADSLEIYERARKEVTIPRVDGRRQMYAAVRYRKQIQDGYAEGNLVEAIGRVVRRRTQGYGHLEAAERPDLMVEALVLDKRRPYHYLFPAATVAVAKARMDEYWARHPEQRPTS